MKKLLVGLVAVLALGALAASAFAAGGNTVWLCNSAFLTLEKCLTVSENLTALTLQDMNESSSVECAVGTVLDEGWVGPGSEDETTSVTFTSECAPSAKALNLAGETVSNACTGTKAVGKALNLPWKTLVYLEGTTTRDIISGTTNGEPGYEVECTVSGLKVKDKCLTSAAADDAHIELNNLAAEGSEPTLVDVLFMEKLVNASEAAKCSLGGAESGLIEGEVLIAAVNSSGTLISLETSEE